MDNGQDLNRCDYDVTSISDYDQRFEKSKKSAAFLHILGIIASVLGTSWMFYFGTGDPTQMSYFLGFPLWFSGATVIYILSFLIGIIYIWKWDEFPLTARDNVEEEKKCHRI